ncbi:hypothetical protein [Acinetobacter larvae]|uniref:Uncharacterized protein n=1 Tax=Acinetobacter larvae TaxID=1789224 RepID=A0A1B2LZC7_9GAMM|nr:hypothetical protein [Acinetobacter larvae]AOA58277.2 hypothetical protein BFG52_07845 [Acinetobacter larvae]
MLTTGRDFEYIRSDFDIPRLNALTACNRRIPPVPINIHRIRLLIEAFMGIEDDEQDNVENNDDDDELLNDLRNFPQGG